MGGWFLFMFMLGGGGTAVSRGVVFTHTGQLPAFSSQGAKPVFTSDAKPPIFGDNKL